MLRLLAAGSVRVVSYWSGRVIGWFFVRLPVYPSLSAPMQSRRLLKLTISVG